MEVKLSKKTTNYMAKNVHGQFINGQWTEPGGGLLAITNPATEEMIGQVSIASPTEVNEAVVSAHKSFVSGEWGKLRPAGREKLLLDFADKLESELDTIAEILTLENGKLLAQAKGEVKGAANTFRYYAGWATKIEGETLDLSLKQKPGKQNFAFIKREPIGVVAAIVPWNFPISIAAWKLAPLLAAGCTVVLKPSEISPLSTLYLAELFNEVGFPKGDLIH